MTQAMQVWNGAQEGIIQFQILHEYLFGRRRGRRDTSFAGCSVRCSHEALRVIRDLPSVRYVQADSVVQARQEPCVCQENAICQEDAPWVSTYNYGVR